MDGHDDEGNPVIECSTAWQYEDEPKAFYLRHSCDEWVIGGTKQAKEFVAILQKLIDENPDIPDVEFREPN